MFGEQLVDAQAIPVGRVRAGGAVSVMDEHQRLLRNRIDPPPHGRITDPEPPHLHAMDLGIGDRLNRRTAANVPDVQAPFIQHEPHGEVPLHAAHVIQHRDQEREGKARKGQPVEVACDQIDGHECDADQGQAEDIRPSRVRFRVVPTALGQDIKQTNPPPVHWMHGAQVPRNGGWASPAIRATVGGCAGHPRNQGRRLGCAGHPRDQGRRLGCAGYPRDQGDAWVARGVPAIRGDA